MRTSLKIGLLTPACCGYNAVDSGIGEHFANLAIGLSDAGHMVWVITPAPPDGAAFDPRLSAIQFVPFSVRMPTWLHQLTRWRWQLHSVAGLRHRIAVAARVLAICAEKEQLDVVETSSTGLLAARYLRMTSRVPVVTRVSTTVAQLVAHNAGGIHWSALLEQRWESQLVHRSDGLITHTQNHRDELCRLWRLPTAAFAIIPHGIALPSVDQLVRPEEREIIDVLYVGRFEYRKGIDVLLEVIPGILAAQPEVRFTLIGHDAHNRWQARFRERNPQTPPGQVVFPGLVSTECLRAAYRDCDVFVAPSRYESFGLIYAEAMSWAKPVVGCRAGGIAEVVADGETGWLVFPGDATSLRQTLLSLVRDRDIRRRFGEAGRRRVEALFSRSVLAQNSVGYYWRIIAANGAEKP